MMTTHSVLALESLKGYMNYLPLAVAIVCGVILLIAFCIGFAKGAKKVRWGGVAWLAAGVGYIFADKFLRDKNPLNGMLQGRFSAEIVSFASSFSIALACILIVLLLCGVFALFCRPGKEKKRKKESLDTVGVGYDENFEYQVFDKTEKKTNRKKGKPSFFGRVLGALACTINTAMVLATIVIFLLFIVYSTKLKNGVLAPIFTVPYVQFVLKYALLYAVDLAIVGVIFGFARMGRRVGFFNILRPIVVKVGGAVAIAACFYLPFSKYLGSVTLLNSLVTRCVGALASVGAGAKVATIAGKIVAGVLMCIVVALAIWLLNFAMKKLSQGIKSVGVFRALDCTLSCLIFLVLGVAVVALVLAITYALAHYGLFYAGGLLTGETTLSRGLYGVFDLYLKGYLERFSGVLQGLLAKIPF
ncbi:MAG: hypothetical protein IJ514_01980 [Clostridia bacterium]|nr:hypothetical protein [Clostridia bacterium]